MEHSPHPWAAAQIVRNLRSPGLLQFSETPGLVQVRLLPPAGNAKLSTTAAMQEVLQSTFELISSSRKLITTVRRLLLHDCARQRSAHDRVGRDRQSGPGGCHRKPILQRVQHRAEPPGEPNGIAHDREYMGYDGVFAE